jgi:hypothetical protein
MTTTTRVALAGWLRTVQDEYLDMPGQQLTKPQMQRLWGFEDAMCDAVVDELVANHFLRPSSHDTFVLDEPRERR